MAPICRSWKQAVGVRWAAAVKVSPNECALCCRRVIALWLPPMEKVRRNDSAKFLVMPDYNSIFITSPSTAKRPTSLVRADQSSSPHYIVASVFHQQKLQLLPKQTSLVDVAHIANLVQKNAKAEQSLKISRLATTSFITFTELPSTKAWLNVRSAALNVITYCLRTRVATSCMYHPIRLTPFVIMSVAKLQFCIV